MTIIWILKHSIDPLLHKSYILHFPNFLFQIMVEYFTFLRNHTQNTEHTHFELVQNLVYAKEDISRKKNATPLRFCLQNNNTHSCATYHFRVTTAHISSFIML